MVKSVDQSSLSENVIIDDDDDSNKSRPGLTIDEDDSRNDAVVVSTTTTTTTTTTISQDGTDPGVGTTGGDNNKKSDPKNDDDDEDDDYEDDDDFDEDDDNESSSSSSSLRVEMPLLNYSRIVSTGLPRKRPPQQPLGGGRFIMNLLPPTSPTSTSTMPSSSSGGGVGPLQPVCTCSEMTVIIVDPDDMNHHPAPAVINSSSSGNITTTTTVPTSVIDTNNNNNNTGHQFSQGQSSHATQQQQQAQQQQQQQYYDSHLLLSSDLWQQPHLIVACGWDTTNKISMVTIKRDGGGGSSSTGSTSGGRSSSSSSGISPPVVFVSPNSGGGTNTLVGNFPSSLGGGAGGGTGTGTTSATTPTTPPPTTATLQLSIREVSSSTTTAVLEATTKTTGGIPRPTQPTQPQPSSYSVVDMSFDSSGTVLGAIDKGGACTIWEFKYTTSMQPNYLLFPPPPTPLSSSSPSTNNNNTVSTTTIDEVRTTATTTTTTTTGIGGTVTSNNQIQSRNPPPVSGNTTSTSMFSNFMSALTGMPPTATTTTTSTSKPTTTATTTSTTTDSINPSSFRMMGSIFLPPITATTTTTTTPAAPASVSTTGLGIRPTTREPSSLILPESTIQPSSSTLVSSTVATTTTSTSDTGNYGGSSGHYYYYTPTLTASIQSVSRINYPMNWGPPTCMVLDPSYKKRGRDKSILVGFMNGRLVLTKRGTFFQRRNDTVLYQASTTTSTTTTATHPNTGISNNNNNSGGGVIVDTSYRGIETVVWRGPLVAWADMNGIKLLDMDNLTRIAHIDRPTGARPSLYPTVLNMRPNLFFETSNSLLVAWGDCLMEMYVKDATTTTTPSTGTTTTMTATATPRMDGSSATTGGSTAVTTEGGKDGQSEVKKRRTVECTMAWELDCVACDVVPFDADHVVVLGLVPSPDDGHSDVGGEEGNGPTIGNNVTNDVEVQILSRRDGTVLHCDSLPIIKQSTMLSSTSSSKFIPDSALRFRLLSSFALSRMDNADETKNLQYLLGSTNNAGLVGIDVEFDVNQPLFPAVESSRGSNKVEFRDPHLQWNVRSVLLDHDDLERTRVAEGGIKGTTKGEFRHDDDTSSVDSDDYECILHPIETVEPSQAPTTRVADFNPMAPAPTMVICTGSDAVVSFVSNVDDAVANALDRHKCALALKRGLRHRRQLRRFDLDGLINRYLEALLRISANKEKEPPGKGQTRMGMTRSSSSTLSLRRMQLAVKAMPVLFGDKIALWERWAKELETIPGSLFLLRKYLPVRDPVLPPTLFYRVLEKMLLEVEDVAQAQKENLIVSTEATCHFIGSLLAWGPTKVLKEYIGLYRLSRNRTKEDTSTNERIKALEISLQRRYLQTAAGYLTFPVKDLDEELHVSAPQYDAHKDDSQDSLYSVSKVVSFIARRTPLVATPNDVLASDGSDSQNKLSGFVPNSHLCLEAMARLRMMQGRYDLALKCFLAISACHASDPLESFERSAIDIIDLNKVDWEDTPVHIGAFSYDYVLALIENRHLHQFLLQRDFLSPSDSRLFIPLFALLRLVGLQRLGDFLIEHCVSPDDYADNATTEAKSRLGSQEGDQDTLRRESLPIDQVTNKLQSSPALLHWYLHLVLTRRPDFYVKFPTNSIPSNAITSLHRKHFQLYVDFAGVNRDSSIALAGTEPYKVEAKMTPLLFFLKAALPLGGVLPVDARRVLERERSREAINRKGQGTKGDFDGSSSPIFALELAYIIESYTEQTETEAVGILDLYLKGAKSVMLAVLYAQRQRRFSSMLWERLITYCLSTSADVGGRFGELLEAAALSGADLARLVESIPPGMNIEGLRPRLVAAVADYRMKLEIYTAAKAAGSEEEVTLLREITHRSRRGVRYHLEKSREKSFAELIQEKNKSDESIIGEKISEDLPTTLSRGLRIKARPERIYLAYSIPRR